MGGVFNVDLLARGEQGDFFRFAARTCRASRRCCSSAQIVMTASSSPLPVYLPKPIGAIMIVFNCDPRAGRHRERIMTHNRLLFEAFRYSPTSQHGLLQGTSPNDTLQLL